LCASSLDLLLGRQDPDALRFKGCAHLADLHDALLELAEFRLIRGNDNRQAVAALPEIRNLPPHVDHIHLNDRAREVVVGIKSAYFGVGSRYYCDRRNVQEAAVLPSCDDQPQTGDLSLQVADLHGKLRHLARERPRLRPPTSGSEFNRDGSRVNNSAEPSGEFGADEK
jgi:hypothetical protein